MTTTTGSRAYMPGEDRSAAARGTVICQSLMGSRSRRICNGPVEPIGNAAAGNGVPATIYQCQRYAAHRFMVWGDPARLRVADVSATEKAEW
jgi:hypothetical protein